MQERVCSIIRMKPPVHEGVGFLFASGDTVPTDADTGFQTGCIFQHTNGGVGTALYVNEGDEDSCAFNAVEPLESITIGDLGDVADGYATRLLETGTYQSTAGGGVALSVTNQRPFALLFDDNGAALGGAGEDYRASLSRVLLTVDNAACTINAMRGQVKALDLVDIAATSVIAGVCGYFEFAGTGARSLAGHVAVVRAAIEEGASGTTTIATASYYAGFEATLNSTRVYTTTGQMAAFMCNISGGTSVWPIGYLVDASSCTTGIQVGSCTTGIFVSGAFTGIALSVINTALTVGDAYSGMRSIVTAPAASNAYGMSGYFDATITGTTAGHCYGLGSWINTSTTPVLSAGHLIVPLECGVYTGEAQATARVVLCQLQAVLTGAPASLHVFRVNTTQTTTAVIAAANPGSVGYTAGAGTAGTQLGYIPIADIVGTGVVYIRVYDSAS